MALFGIMAHSYRSFFVHVVFHVKDLPILHDDVAPLHAYMRTVMADIGCKYITVGGIEDHVHILAMFPPDSVGKTINKVKTTATRWLKRSRPAIYHAFSWQPGSGQFTVSYSLTEKVQNYIERQREHHQKIGSEYEFIRFLEQHNIPYESVHDLPIKHYPPRPEGAEFQRALPAST